jgi:hypothetical protein
VDCRDVTTRLNSLHTDGIFNLHLEMRAPSPSGATVNSPGKGQARTAGARAADLRHEERIAVGLPVFFEGGGRGTTRNVSASGVYVETDDAVRLGLPVKLVIEFTDHPGGPLRVACEAEILRVEERGAGRGIAARLRWIGRE